MAVVYREAGDKVPAVTEPSRTITIEKVEHEVAPHGWGRHRCPFCAAGRRSFLPGINPDRGVGRAIALVQDDKAVRPVLRRICGTCNAVWYVEPWSSF